MVKRNWFKVSALFIVLTFVMSIAPSMCFAEGDAAASSNVVFQIWQDTPLSEITSGGESWATFADKATQEGGIKFLNKTTADYYAKDEVNAAAILHGDYKNTPQPPRLQKHIMLISVRIFRRWLWQTDTTERL